MTGTPRKTEFYWASIAGADPEPVERCTVDGRPAVFTLGCNDPFFLEDPNCPVVLGSLESFTKAGKAWSVFDPTVARHLERPRLPTKLKGPMAAAEAAYEKSGPHSWRGPR